MKMRLQAWAIRLIPRWLPSWHLCLETTVSKNSAFDKRGENIDLSKRSVRWTGKNRQKPFERTTLGNHGSVGSRTKNGWKDCRTHQDERCKHVATSAGFAQRKPCRTQAWRKSHLLRAGFFKGRWFILSVARRWGRSAWRNQSDQRGLWKKRCLCDVAWCGL